jgi:Flp pilus assembly protein TadG
MARRGWRAGESGASAVEFAIVLPLLLLILFGIIEFGLAFNRIQALEAASREAGRLASVGFSADELQDEGSEVNALIRATAASTVRPQDVRVTVERDCGDGVADGGISRAEVAVDLDPASLDRYSIRIPVLGRYLEEQLDYRAVSVFRCEERP